MRYLRFRHRPADRCRQRGGVHGQHRGEAGVRSQDAGDWEGAGGGWMD